MVKIVKVTPIMMIIITIKILLNQVGINVILFVVSVQSLII